MAYVLFLVFLEVNTAAGQGLWNAVFYAFIFGTGAPRPIRAAMDRARGVEGGHTFGHTPKI
ncbi:MAG: hypothetical protein JOZ22_22640 [Acidobacteriia bacterium]|nr:hypothetical protein [Terriglobia bacterium]